MNWYERRVMAEYRERELERAVEQRRNTTGERRPLNFWLISVLRAWIIGAA